MSKAVTMQGEVARRRINPGSKSEHEAVVIVCRRGEFKLRRKGGHPFTDPELQPLVGKRIRATGILSAGQFIMERCDVLDE